MKNRVTEVFKKQNGYLFSKNLKNRTEQYQIKLMIDAGEVVRIKRGLYKHLRFSSDSNDWAEICRIVPSGVLCLFSAWQYYELTNTVSPFYHVALENKSKVSLPEYPPISIYYWSKNYIEMGKITLTENGEKINICTIEKAVCDAVKFRNKIGMEIMSEVLKNYVKRNDRNLNELMKYAKDVRIDNVIKPYLQSLI